MWEQSVSLCIEIQARESNVTIGKNGTSLVRGRSLLRQTDETRKRTPNRKQNNQNDVRES